MTTNCPYCGDEKKPRGLKNHIRMASGNGHGDSGTLPDDYESSVSDGEDGADDAPEAVETEPTEVAPEDFEDADDDESAADNADSADDAQDYPFDPSDPDAIELDGGEVVDLRVGNDIYSGVEAHEGDYLLKTDEGPVLYDHQDDELYEIITV